MLHSPSARGGIAAAAARGAGTAGPEQHGQASPKRLGSTSPKRGKQGIDTEVVRGETTMSMNRRGKQEVVRVLLKTARTRRTPNIVTYT